MTVQQQDQGLMISVIWQDAAQVTTALSVIVLSEPVVKCMYVI